MMEIPHGHVRFKRPALALEVLHGLKMELENLTYTDGHPGKETCVYTATKKSCKSNRTPARGIQKSCINTGCHTGYNYDH